MILIFITDEKDKKKERYMIREVCIVCGYPQLTFRLVQEKIKKNAEEEEEEEEEKDKH